MTKDEENIIVEWSKKVIFHLILKLSEKNMNIYELVDFLAWEVIKFIKILIERYELFYDNFVYSTRLIKIRLVCI